MNAEVEEKNGILETEHSEDTFGVVTFHLAGELFGAEMVNVREIIHVDAVTPLYRVDEFLRGLINLRGQIKPVIDLGLFLGIDPTIQPEKKEGENPLRPAVMLTFEGAELACLVDRIDTVQWLSPQSIREVAGIVNEDMKRYVKFTIKTEGRPISILNVDHIMNSDVWKKYRLERGDGDE